MRLIKLKEVMHLTALGRSSIYKMMEDKTFPKSINLGIRSVAWIESEILEWIEEIIANNQ
ncbi:MAG: prophage regulatory protein [Cocleimonas sp.]|jgi:prophage regulatory protein